MRFGDRDMIATFSPRDVPRMEETVNMSVDVERMCVFDAASGKALA
jgi:hypothetical protein